jgi:hypothetical protein
VNAVADVLFGCEVGTENGRVKKRQRKRERASVRGRDEVEGGREGVRGARGRWD